MAARAIALAMQNSMHTTKLPFENAPTSSSAVLACRLPSRLSGTPACSNVARSCCGDASLTTGFLSSEADSAYSHSRSAAFFFFLVGACWVRWVQFRPLRTARHSQSTRPKRGILSNLAEQHELLILLLLLRRRRGRHFFGLLGRGRPPACHGPALRTAHN